MHVAEHACQVFRLLKIAEAVEGAEGTVEHCGQSEVTGVREEKLTCAAADIEHAGTGGEVMQQEAVRHHHTRGMGSECASVSDKTRRLRHSRGCRCRDVNGHVSSSWYL